MSDINYGLAISTGAAPISTAVPLPKGKKCLCGGSNDECQWCYGTAFVHETLYEAYDAARNERDKHSIFSTQNDADRERESQRVARLMNLSAKLREAMDFATKLNDEKLKTEKSARVSEEVWGPFLPWHSLPPSSVPAVSFGVNEPALKINEAHTDRVHRDEVMGAFCGEPIVWLDELGMETDRELEISTLCGPTRPYIVWYDLYDAAGTQRSLVRPDKYYNPEYGTIKQSTHDNAPAEILPGEKRCEDGVIRRLTATEVVGYDTYHNQEAIEAGQQHVGLEEARKAAEAGSVVYWRPNRATLEAYKVGTELPCLPIEPEPFALILQGGAQ